jgi:ribonuclease III
MEGSHSRYRSMSDSPLANKLGYVFKDASLLELALTHRSFGARNNERLEFLGDSVLGACVSSLLFQRFGKLNEGDLSRVRANLVKQAALADIANRLEMSQHLRLGEGELKSGGFRRPSILADTLEAVIGAVFLDGGFDAAQALIHKLYEPIVKSIDPKTIGKDAKTLLQEFLQAHKLPLPTYTVIATHGAAHSQQFEVSCDVEALDIQVQAAGASRRAAEQTAAKQALEKAMSLKPASGSRKSVTKARKAAQLTLPVAVVQDAR